MLALQQLAAHRLAGFKAIVARFIELDAGGHPWSFTDLIADFLADVHSIVTDVAIRGAITERPFVLGDDHNRFHVGEVFARLAASSTDPSDVMAIPQVMRDNPQAVPFNAFYLEQHSLPQLLLTVIDELT